MTDTERAQLAAIEHYDRRAAELRQVRGLTAVWDTQRALDTIARARRAELLDPDPLPHIERGA